MKSNSTKRAIKGINMLDLYQKQFVVKLDGKEIYDGSFLLYVSSTPCFGVVIVDILSVQS